MITHHARNTQNVTYDDILDRLVQHFNANAKEPEAMKNYHKARSGPPYRLPPGGATPHCVRSIAYRPSFNRASECKGEAARSQ